MARIEPKVLDFSDTDAGANDIEHELLARQGEDVDTSYLFRVLYQFIDVLTFVFIQLPLLLPDSQHFLVHLDRAIIIFVTLLLRLTPNSVLI